MDKIVELVFFEYGILGLGWIFFILILWLLVRCQDRSVKALTESASAMTSLTETFKAYKDIYREMGDRN